ncbi:unnamed protein product, partial [Ixodes hexagonus]
VAGAAASVQEFEVTPQDTEVNPGSTVTLRCKVRNRRGECVWLKNGHALGRIPDKYDFEREPQDGDCSVQIRKTTLEEDDGSWQCQVTRATLQDAPLNSEEVKLVVRGTAPLKLLTANNIRQFIGSTTHIENSGRKDTVYWHGSCSSVSPSSLEDSGEVEANSIPTVLINAATRAAGAAAPSLCHLLSPGHELSVLSARGFLLWIYGAANGRAPLEYVRISRYPPEIKYEGSPREEVEEGASLTLSCVSDANPPANIVWRKSGQSSIYDISHSIHFPSIQRTDSGVYSCSAKNDFGDSPELQVTVNVKFRPKIIRVEPPSTATFNVGDVMALNCVAEGNPVPKISWLQQSGRDPNIWNIRGRNATMAIANASYSHQGVYRCEAANTIRNQPYRVQSQEIRIDIRGPPQVLLESSKTRDVVTANKEEDATVTVVFCSDPKPIEAIWGWGSYKLKTGNSLGRFVAEPLLADEELEDCYEARLVIQRVESDDFRKFTLFVDNGKGKASYSVALEVKEPFAMTLVIAITVGGILFIIVFLTIFVYLVRSEKMCFKRRHQFSPDGESDLGSAGSQGTPLTEKSKPGGNGAIPPDALYTPAGKTNGANTNGSSKGTSSDENPQYENVKNGRPDPPPRTADGSIVYASLDLGPPTAQVKNGVRPNPADRTEYAELQFQPSSEHASL